MSNIPIPVRWRSQLFTSSGSYTPKTGAGTCSLIDTGAASHSFGGTLVNAPAYDIAGTTRPMGGG